MTDRIQIKLPASRFISGSMTQKRTTNARGQQIPEDKQQFEFGVALRKDSPDAQQFWGQIVNGFKQCFPNNAQVHGVIDQYIQNGFNGFSGKISDGDQPNAKGQINDNSRGCWVIWLSTSYPPTTLDPSNAQIDPAVIERGYYVDGLLSLAPNNNQIGDGIGCYVNPDAIRMIGQGEVIRGGPDLNAIGAALGAAPAQLPAGAQPVGAPPAGAPPLPGMGNAQAPQPQQQPAPQQPALPGMPTAPTAAPPQPAPTAPMQPPAGGAPQQPTQPATGTGSPTSPQHPPYTGVLPS